MTRPAAVGAWALAGLGVALVGADPISRLVVLAAAWTLLVSHKVPDRKLRPLALSLVVVGVVTIVVNGVLSHTGATVLVAVPSGVPLFGGPITAEGFAAGAGIALSLVAAVSVAAALSVVVEPSDIVDALPGVLHRTGAAVGSALNLVPATAASFTAVRDAQRLRGWEPKGPRAMVDLVVPVLLGAIERSVQLAESMEARAFGSGARQIAYAPQRSRRNTAVVVGALACLTCVIGARIAGAGGGWLPYPTPSVPTAAPLVLVPALILFPLVRLVPEGTP